MKKIAYGGDPEHTYHFPGERMDDTSRNMMDDFRGDAEESAREDDLKQAIEEALHQVRHHDDERYEIQEVADVIMDIMEAKGHDMSEADAYAKAEEAVTDRHVASGEHMRDSMREASLIEEMVKVADLLDARGMTKAAARIDSMMQKLAGGHSYNGDGTYTYFDRDSGQEYEVDYTYEGTNDPGQTYGPPEKCVEPFCEHKVNIESISPEPPPELMSRIEEAVKMHSEDNDAGGDNTPEPDDDWKRDR